MHATVKHQLLTENTFTKVKRGRKEQKKKPHTLKTHNNTAGAEPPHKNGFRYNSFELSPTSSLYFLPTTFFPLPPAVLTALIL